MGSEDYPVRGGLTSSCSISRMRKLEYLNSISTLGPEKRTIGEITNICALFN